MPPAHPRTLGTDTQHAPSPLGERAQPTYMSAEHGSDAGLAGGSGAAASGAAPGRRRPSFGRLGTRAGRPARAQPHLRAPPGACTRPGRLRGLARLAAESRGPNSRQGPRRPPRLIPGPRPRFSATKPALRTPGLASLLPSAGGQLPRPDSGMPGKPRRGGGEETPESGGQRTSGLEAGVGARAPASRLPGRSRRAPARSLLPPQRPRFGGVAEARAAGAEVPLARPPPFRPRNPPVSLRAAASSSAASPPAAYPVLSLTLPWTFHLRFFPFFILSFNFFLPNWPPLAFLPEDSLVWALLKNLNQTVSDLVFESRVSLTGVFFLLFTFRNLEV